MKDLFESILDDEEDILGKVEQNDKVKKEAGYNWLVAHGFKNSRHTDTKEVDDAVQDIMSRLTKVASNITKDPQKYNISSTSFDLIIEKIYDQRRHNGGRSYTSSDYIGKDGLLIWYNRYCSTVIDLRNDKGYYRDPSRLLKDRDAYKKIILELCKNLDAIFKKYDA